MRRPLARSLALGRPGLFYGSAVRDYLDRVRAVDGDGLSRGVTNGINTYISGLISAQMLGTSGGVISQAASTIKAHCILAGANTLSGILVPVVGPAPTNFNFVPADYNRKTGLIGNASTKYLDINRNNNADPQDNVSMSAYISQAGASGTQVYMGCSSFGGVDFGFNTSGLFSRNRNQAGAGGLGASTITGLIGSSRNTSTGYTFRRSGTDTAITQVSQGPANSVMLLFREINQATFYANARISFYHMGESLDLAVLQSLQDQFMATLAAVIP